MARNNCSNVSSPVPSNTMSLNCSINPGSEDSLPWDDHHTDSVSLWAIISAYIVIDVIGLVGNCFVIAVILFCNKMRTSPNFFILSLSFADLLVTLIVIPITAYSRWRRQWVLGKMACVLQAWMTHTTLFASMFSLATIAVNRVVVTRAPAKFHLLFTRRLSGIYIFITWFFAALYASFPVLGWGMYKFDPRRLNCIYSRKAAPSYSFFFAACGVILPLLVCAISYIVIWVTFAVSRQKFRQTLNSGISGNSLVMEMKLTKNLFVIWLVFFICWLPMNVLLFVDPKGLLDGRLYTAAVWFLLCNSCLNPIIYGIQNKAFRRGEFIYRHKPFILREVAHTRLSSKYWSCHSTPPSDQR